MRSESQRDLTLKKIQLNEKWVGRLNIIKMSILSSSSNREKSSFQVILNYYTKVNGQGYFEELYLGVGGLVLPKIKMV